MGMFSPKINHVADAFPGTISRRSQYLQNVPVPSIISMVVCQSFEACVERRGLHLLPQPCINCLQSHIRSPLFREVVTTKGARKLYPLCAYPTCSLIKALTSILSRPGIFELCEEWRTSFEADPFTVKDMFSGKVWTDFLCHEGESFLASKRSIGVMLNIDWFQTFKHRQYSVGVLYLAVMNLPRAIRYKRENVLLIGLTINVHLDPLVDDLLLLWKGVPLQQNESNMQTIRCALLCVACDLPAGRKACGFLSYTANLGCSRCYSNFGTGVFG